MCSFNKALCAHLTKVILKGLALQKNVFSVFVCLFYICVRTGFVEWLEKRFIMMTEFECHEMTLYVKIQWLTYCFAAKCVNPLLATRCVNPLLEARCDNLLLATQYVAAVTGQDTVGKDWQGLMSSISLFYQGVLISVRNQRTNIKSLSASLFHTQKSDLHTEKNSKQ